jgi:hypothetical protein
VTISAVNTSTLLALLALSIPAHAIDQVTVSVPIPVNRTANPNQPQALLVPGFDPALGTLVGMRCHMLMHELMEARGENESPAPAVIEWKTSIGFQMSALDSTILFDRSFPERTASERCAPYDGLTDFLGPSGFTVNLKAVIEELVYETGRPIDLARFIGAGPRPFVGRYLGTNVFTAGTANTTATLDHKMWARLVVTYYYRTP